MRCSVALLCKTLTLFSSVSRDVVFKNTLMLYSSITSYHFQQTLVSQSLLFVTKYYQQSFSQHADKQNSLQYHGRSQNYLTATLHGCWSIPKAKYLC